MQSKNKRKASNAQLPVTESNHPHKKHHNLHSDNKVIESERQSNKTLPDKLWYKVQFAVGINEVTRLLERMNPLDNAAFATPLQAVLVASDCNPRSLIKHLPSLATSRKVPLLYVKDKKEGSLRLGELVKVKTAIAIGVKAKESSINQFVQGVIHPDELNEIRCLDP
ncbi:hypothetical protein KSS87_011729 [Heliosperma pusillum]|nr:hypothetical protein KSS87_011276 [Heliosperma pusillum]KAH9613234.1 hypothetical protein KSS87_011729 [Heliosperma pusillum]